MYLNLIDTVIKIVKKYGVGILSDPKFWHILTDSYSFASEYALRNIFKSCLATGYISRLVAFRGNTKKTKNEISHIIKSENNINPGKEQDYAAVLYSVGIAIGSCTKKDYTDFINQNRPKPITPPIPNPNSGPQSNTPLLDKLKFMALVLIGVVILTGSLLSYGLFFFCEASMFGLLFITGLFQVGYCKVLDKFFHSKVSNQLKVRTFVCIIPIIVGFVFISVIPLILCSDSISDAVYTYFSAEFIPESYHVVTSGRVWYAPRLSPSVGFWGCLASVALFVSLVSCTFRINECKDKQKLQFSHNDKISLGAIVAIIVLNIGVIVLIPPLIIMRQRTDFEKIEANNKRLYQERKDIVQDLSVKGIKLGISNETAWEYMNSIKDDQEPSQLHYYETIKHPDAIYDEFIGTSYYSVFPYEIPMSDFEGVSIGGEDYRMLISLDNTTVGLDIYTYDGLVTAMRIYGLGNSNNSLSNFESLLSLYTTKYGQPEIIKDFSREKDIFAIMPYRSKGKNDRYVWNFKNGRIEMSKLGIMYISETLISKVRKECVKSIKELEFAKKRKIEQERIRKEKADSLKHMQEKRDSIRRVRNHKNAINEI